MNHSQTKWAKAQTLAICFIALGMGLTTLNYVTKTLRGDPSLLVSVCRSSHSEAFCTHANTTEQPIKSCKIATLTHKDNGSTLRSLPLCVVVAPQSIVEVKAPWVGGVASDICHRRALGGVKILNWDKCELTFGEMAERP